jgi:hypothetical protein
VLIKDSNIDRWEKHHPLGIIRWTSYSVSSISWPSGAFTEIYQGSPSPLGPHFTCQTLGLSDDPSLSWSYNQMRPASIEDIVAVPGLDLRYCGNNDTDMETRQQLWMNCFSVALTETTRYQMIGALLYKLRFDKAEMNQDFQGDAEYLIPLYMKSITAFKMYKEITREADEGGSSRGSGKSNILTPSLMQKRRLLKPPQEQCGFAPFDCVIPALLMAP